MLEAIPEEATPINADMRTQSAKVVGAAKKSKKRTVMRRRLQSSSDVKSSHPTVERPTISPEGFITLATDGYEVEARYADPSTLYTTGDAVGEGGFGKVDNPTPQRNLESI